MTKLIIAALIATVILIFAFTQIDPKVNNINPDSQISLVDNNRLTVTVTGQVTRPGTFALEKGATFEELIMAAGGPTAKADARAYILTTDVVDGMSYFIASLYDENDICNDYPLAKVNINNADKDLLMTVNGIGSTIASALVTYRETDGEFSYLEEIMNVTGIGNATFEKIKNSIVLQ
ncbi:MAG: helix-hairpin-helix domain-containing protein [Bacilli bacterium]|jgi:competence protein ComEA|nr:helix-hairpin-helix domain-containing protein [Bacilli bacterium]MDD3388897.1 helix-hairpin-helix domain-containing protein [Bacilli bacterium]MDD4344649.1 helix-hairpin-helix domain-containing protein [Bacilli bacterium]MDD4520577.1 helix-hairpin-helix domain-containing protein [Bacilli bacterium]MDY0399269.1 helix-hairpin-helix domain-containing protein [Bacilli bacterium]